jgi:hypothetical protein
MLNALTNVRFWGKAAVTNRCLPISIYEYTASPAQVPSGVNQAASEFCVGPMSEGVSATLHPAPRVGLARACTHNRQPNAYLDAPPNVRYWG